MNDVEKYWGSGVFLVNIYGKGSNFKQPNLSLICNEGIVGFEFTTP
jgi:hypothetical protein